jgi:hypothetical protein
MVINRFLFSFFINAVETQNKHTLSLGEGWGVGVFHKLIEYIDA